MILEEKLEVKKIKEEYEYKEDSNLVKLRKLDKKAKLPSIIFAYTFGIIGSLVMGFGMSILLGSILANMTILGYVMGILGLVLISINYPIYRLIHNKGKKKYENQIIELSNIMLQE